MDVEIRLKKPRVLKAYRLLKEYLRTGDASLLEAMKKNDWVTADVSITHLPNVKVEFSRPGLVVVDLETGVAHRCDDKVEVKTDKEIALECTERGKPVSIRLGYWLYASRLALLAFLMEQGVDVLEPYARELERACRRMSKFYEEVTGKKLENASCETGEPPPDMPPPERVYEQHKRLVKAHASTVTASARLDELLNTELPNSLIDALRSTLAPYDGYEVECMLRPEDSDKAPWLNITKPRRYTVSLDVGRRTVCVRVKHNESKTEHCDRFMTLVYASLCMPDLMKKALNKAREIMEERKEMRSDMAKVLTLFELLEK